MSSAASQVETRPRAMSKIGPGIVLALAAIGPGDFVSNTSAGATHGYSLLWVLAFCLIIRYVWLNTAAKYILVSGESLFQGYARVGEWIVWLCLGAFLVMRHCFNMYKYPLMGECLHLMFPLPAGSSAFIWSMVTIFAGFALLWWGGYNAIEVFLKFLIVAMGGSLVAVLFLSHPQPGGILRGLLVPSLPQSAGGYSTLLLVAALIGTESASLADTAYCYFLDAKGWRKLDLLERQRKDLLFSVLCMFSMGALLQIVAAGTLRPVGIVPENARDLTGVFSHTLGAAGRFVFAFGLWGAAFSGYIAGTSSTSMIVADIVRRVIPRMYGRTPAPEGGSLKRDPVYRACVVFFCFSPMYIMFTEWKPVAVILYISAALVASVPILTWALYQLTNNEQLLGRYKNGLVTNGLLLLIVIASVVCLVQGAAGWLAQRGPAFWVPST